MVVGAREVIEAVGTLGVYLLPYRPKFDPIEQIFAKLEHLLRAATAGTVPDL